ncbi:hypothetical protein UCDDS831_g00429 [Diplodia seriata]|uniref:Rhodopsin domain-containing protein n=1 Tax=Diplodia seriata TaxID=420778 RepID=A0A0G2F1T3_9PEZI|nr:hypothetical protein UCDDS831_g00429 [Diplodia seriata]
MSDSASQNYFTANVLTNTGYALIVVTSATVITRFSIRIWKRKPLQIEDLLVGIAWAAFLALTISYIVVTPPMYHLYAVSGGRADPYPAMMDDALFIIKVFFYSTMLLWVTLWAVKFSLLALYRRLMNGLRTYVVLWWILVVFCAATFVGAIISNLTSCSSMHAWFSPGECGTPRDINAQIASLYYAFAVDILTDLLIMALPIRLIWNLQMPRAEKLAVGALFCSGFVCITMAVLRVVQIGVKAGNNSTPSSSWLALWAEVEAATAVFIGCCPAFAAFYRTAKSSSSGSGRGYSKRKENRSGGSERSDFGEELAKGAQGIYVTRSIRQDSEDSGERRPVL